MKVIFQNENEFNRILLL